MTSARISRVWGTILLTIAIFSLSLPAYAKYSGGTGEPNDPYQIATAEDLMLLGETPEDYDKHFILTADIDLDPNLPGRKVFDKTVIASGANLPFTGVFDGNGHTISRLTLTGSSNMGLFGYVWGPTAQVKDLRLVKPMGYYSWNGSLLVYQLEEGTLSNCCVQNCNLSCKWPGDGVGGLVFSNNGTIIGCHVSGRIKGGHNVGGGLVGYNRADGTIISCSSSASVQGHHAAGGLVGGNEGGISFCYSTGPVSGLQAGGLVGDNEGIVSNCYCTGDVQRDGAGGLVGWNSGIVSNCYSAGSVSGTPGTSGRSAGGLVGSGWLQGVTASFWDTQTSGQATSAGGTGKNTAEMQTAGTFLDAGWDFIGETANGIEDIWKIVEGLGYPRLWWEKYSGGAGEPNDPYQIATVEDLMLIGESPKDDDKHFILTADIDLNPNLPGGDYSLISFFTGVFDGNGHTISYLTTDNYLPCLFGSVFGNSTEVKNLRLFQPTGLGGGLLVGQLHFGTISNCRVQDCNLRRANGVLVKENHEGTIIDCHVSGQIIAGGHGVGGLVGNNYDAGTITRCSFSGSIWSEYGGNEGFWCKGGLVGVNNGGISFCYSTGSVTGNRYVGGLVGYNTGVVYCCYSTSSVKEGNVVGGLMGFSSGSVTQCYSTGLVSGSEYTEDIGGLVGKGGATASFWDIETSGQISSSGGIGKTTAEMQTAATFLNAGWDFAGEVTNGTEDIWTICEGQDYPKLAWQFVIGDYNGNGHTDFTDFCVLGQHWVGTDSSF